MAGDKKENRSLEVQNLRHHEATPPNNPPAGVAPTFEVRPRERQRYEDDPHLDPQLAWAGKGKPTSFAVEVVSLHIHERISTRAILDAVRRPQPLQLDLFAEPKLPEEQQIEFYKHEIGWANRLIRGDSLAAMNSLWGTEGMKHTQVSQEVKGQREQISVSSLNKTKDLAETGFHQRGGVAP